MFTLLKLRPIEINNYEINKNKTGVGDKRADNSPVQPYDLYFYQ